MQKQKPFPKNDDQIMAEQWQESALAERKRRREDREKARLESESNFRQMDEWTGGKTMRPEGACPCGKHRGVVFMNGTNRLNPNPLCPVTVWLFWQKKGIINGDWEKTIEDRPLEGFLNQFRMGG